MQANLKYPLTKLFLVFQQPIDGVFQMVRISILIYDWQESVKCVCLTLQDISVDL